jgi:uncharacterized protein YceH (UPF0502 family)
MLIQLMPIEARAIGCLIEKQLTTPDQYPLSLNALTNACNQKNNREPVLALSEAEVQATLDALGRKHLVLERSGFGSRVSKYQQRFCNTEFSVFQFTPPERAVVCELLLRGPQTPGELRSRAARLAPLTDAAEVEAVLKGLAEREGGALVARLPPEPGRREARYAHLFSGEPAPAAAAATAPAGEPVPGEATGHAGVTADASVLERLARLEHEVRELRRQLELRPGLHDGAAKAPPPPEGGTS